MKTFLTLSIIYLLWYLPMVIFPFAYIPYNILWSISFFFITISIQKVVKKINNNYLAYLFINYLYLNSFRVFFIYFQSHFYSTMVLIVTIISATFLYNETRKIDKKSSYYLFPYLLSVLSLIILLIYF